MAIIHTQVHLWRGAGGRRWLTSLRLSKIPFFKMRKRFHALCWWRPRSHYHRTRGSPAVYGATAVAFHLGSCSLGAFREYVSYTLLSPGVPMTREVILKRAGRFTKWGPTVAGLAIIPLLPYVDHPIEVGPRLITISRQCACPKSNTCLGFETPETLLRGDPWQLQAIAFEPLASSLRCVAHTTPRRLSMNSSISSGRRRPRWRGKQGPRVTRAGRRRWRRGKGGRHWVRQPLQHQRD